MPNTLTDQFQLVKTSTLDANFIQILLGKTVNYNDGFCRELFRDGRHLKSLRSPSDTFSAHKGDTMLSVNMGIVTVTFTDKLPTRDGYFITYEGTARLFVLDPRMFAICYVQGIDPLQKTVDVIMAALKREVARGKHDDMTDEYLRHVVENYTGARVPTPTQHGRIDVTPVTEYGVAIWDAQTMSPHADPKRVAEIEEARRVKDTTDRMARDEAIKLAELKSEETVKLENWRVQEALDQKQRETDIRKRDDTLDDEKVKWLQGRELSEEGARRDAALKMQIDRAQRQEEADSRLLGDLRSRGYSTADILQHHPELRYLFEKRDIVTGALLNGDELLRLSAAEPARATQSTPPADDGASAATEPRHGITREPRENDIYTISHFGVKVSRHALTEQERAFTQIPDLMFAYQIETMVATGPLSQMLKQTDLIYQIGDRPVPELLSDLAPYLDHLQRLGDPVRVTYLRCDDDGRMYSDVALIEIPTADA